MGAAVGLDLRFIGGDGVILADRDARPVSLSDVNCPFCEELDDFGKSQFLRLLPDWPYPTRTVQEWSDFILVPGVAPLTDLYFLLVPKTHALSILETDVGAVTEIVEQLSRVYARLGQRLMVFEHGDCGASSRTSCLEHGHLHLMPSTNGVLRAFARDYPARRVDSFEEAQLLHTGRGYLLAGERGPEADSLLFCEPEQASIVPQYFRRMLPRTLSSGAYCWRRNFNRHLVLQSFESIAEALMQAPIEGGVT